MYATHNMTTQEVLSAFTAQELAIATGYYDHQIVAEQTSEIRTDFYLKVKRRGQDIIVASVCIIKNMDGTFMVAPDYGNHHPIPSVRTMGKSSLIAQDYLLAMLCFAARYIGTETT